MPVPPPPPPSPPPRVAARLAGMGWPGGAPCCCPGPPRPRPSGRPPQVSGRATPSGNAGGGPLRHSARSEPGAGARGRGGRQGSRNTGRGGSPRLGLRPAPPWSQGARGQLEILEVTRGRGTAVVLVQDATPHCALLQRQASL